jgi:hypothetical protein
MRAAGDFVGDPAGDDKRCIVGDLAGDDNWCIVGMQQIGLALYVKYKPFLVDAIYSYLHTYEADTS